MKNSRPLFTCLILLNFLAFFASSQQTTPESLQPWVPWVMVGNEEIQCPFINHSDYSKTQNHICAWGGPLTLDAHDNGGKFTQSWQVLTKSFIPLPGDRLSWPQQIVVNQKAVAVIEHNGQAVVQLEAGKYQLEGQFNWQKVPQSIKFPAQTAVVNLSVNGISVVFPKIEGGELWIQQNQLKQQQQDEIEINVARKISDGDTLKLDTFIKLSVSGKMREVALGSVLPKGFSLIGIQSKLPAFLDADGLLYVKVKPGEWEIIVAAFASPTLLTWQRPPINHLWPTDEVWVFAGNEKFRNGKISGAQPIDSEQAAMPADWYALPSYLLPADGSLNYEISHRGMPVQLENNLRLERNLWLAFDQKTLNFVDNITGTMNTDWRISMPPPFILESAEDEDGAVLITTIGNNEKGVETRYSGVNIQTRGSVQTSTSLPVSGYNSDFENIELTLYLPPGNSLFAVLGADRVSSSWWSNWSIWSSFIVLLASIAAARLVNVMTGVLSAVTFLFIYQQSAAPVLIMLNLLLAFALRKHLNFTALRTVINIYWGLSASLALGAILFFAASQLRTVIYPQLEANNAHPVVEDFNQELRSATKYEVMSPSISQADSLDTITVSGSRMRDKDVFTERYQTDALMQAGSGIPDWQWKSYTINWHSPVTSSQQFKLLVLSKNMNRVFKSIGIALTLVWLYVLLGNALKGLLTQIKTRAVVTVLAVMLFLPSYSPPSLAQDFPEQTLLETLRNRMLAAPDCAPQCANISHLNVTATGSELELQFTLHALSATAIALPRSEMWRAERLVLNNKTIAGLYKLGEWIYVPLEAGISQLKVIGQLVGADEIQLEFKEQPKYISVTNSKDWQVIGLQDHILGGNSLTLLNSQTKQTEESQPRSRYSQQALVNVTRKISFDQQWRITTTVTRIAPAQGSISMTVPILEGESVISSAVTIQNQNVDVTIAAGEQSTQWRSTLQRTPTLNLTASSQLPLIEHWVMVVSPAWHADMQGVPLVLEQQSADDYYAFHFYPHPGESLQLELQRPLAVEGHVLAFDQANLSIEQGTRTTTLQLNLNYRSTRGTEHTIELPADYQLKELKIDGKIVNLATQANLLKLPVYPGTHEVAISMRANAEQTLLFSAPTFNLNAPMSNITTQINVNSQRWVLWTSGPTLGPAVLYWGELLTFILLALMLSRLTFSPLSPISWIILGLGLSLNNWTILMMIVVWFGAITASQYRSKSLSVSQYNATQAGLYVWTTITILSLIAIVPLSLLSSPNMGITGNYSSDFRLKWFADQSQGWLPDIMVISVPVWIYKALMLVWVIWLSFALINWIKWSWNKLGTQGYWKKTAIIQTPIK